MKRLFESIAFEGHANSSSPKFQTGKIAYEFLDSDGAAPYVRISFSMRVEGSDKAEFELDIPRDDMVDLLNEVIDEWPDIVDSPGVRVRRGVRLIPTFC